MLNQDNLIFLFLFFSQTLTNSDDIITTTEVVPTQLREEYGKDYTCETSIQPTRTFSEVNVAESLLRLSQVCFYILVCLC